MAKNPKKQNTLKASQVFGDYIIMILAPCILSVLYYGSRAATVIFVSVISAVLGDLAMSFIIRKKFLLKDLSNVFIGAAIAVMLPAGVPLYVPAIASVAAVMVAKIPFGGSLRTPFVPAAAGFAMVSICFKEQVFTYTENVEDKLLGAQSLASLLSQGNSVHFNLGNAFDIISGNIAGPMGTGCGLLMLMCGTYLFVRRRKALLATAGFIGACVVVIALMPRINASLLTRIVLELSAGSLLFGSVFLITDYATLPKGNINKIIYGALCGTLCMLMRSNGAYEETVCFAVLLTNGFSPVIESSLKAIPALRKSRKGATEK